MFLPKCSPPVQRKDLFYKREQIYCCQSNKYEIEFNNEYKIGKGLQCIKENNKCGER